MNKLNWSYNAWRKENKWTVQKHKMTLLLSLGLVSYWLDIHEAQIENWGEMLFAPPDCYIHLHHALYFVLNTLFTGTLFRNGIMSIYNWMTIKKKYTYHNRMDQVLKKGFVTTILTTCQKSKLWTSQ